MNSTKLKVPISEFDHYCGPLNAPVNMVEYGDFECPHCATAFIEVERTIHALGTNLCFVYRHFPLVSLHPHAELAALASEAADQQAKFWHMHHLLFQNSEHLSEESIFEMAEELELDMDQFSMDMQSDELRNRVHRQFTGGVRSGVNGTPTFFINSYRYEGPHSYLAFKQVIQTETHKSHSP